MPPENPTGAGKPSLGRAVIARTNEGPDRKGGRVGSTFG
jgi:hypothetical protein